MKYNFNLKKILSGNVFLSFNIVYTIFLFARLAAAIILFKGGVYLIFSGISWMITLFIAGSLWGVYGCAKIKDAGKNIFISILSWLVTVKAAEYTFLIIAGMFAASLLGGLAFAELVMLGYIPLILLFILAAIALIALAVTEGIWLIKICELSFCIIEEQYRDKEYRQISYYLPGMSIVNAVIFVTASAAAFVMKQPVLGITFILAMLSAVMFASLTIYYNKSVKRLCAGECLNMSLLHTDNADELSELQEYGSETDDYNLGKSNIVRDKINEEQINEKQVNKEQAYERHGMICCLTGTNKGWELKINNGEILVIGKDPKYADIIIDSSYKYISRRHCSVEYVAAMDMYRVTDLSTNGTFLISGDRLPKEFAALLPRKTIIYLRNKDNMYMLG